MILVGYMRVGVPEMAHPQRRMARGMVGSHAVSVPAGVSEGYKNSIAAWATRAALEVNDKVGFAHGTIEHPATAASAAAAIKIVDRCSSTAVSTQRSASSATLLVSSNSLALSPTSSGAFDRYLGAREDDVNTLT